jgi:hypothetical protein|tara:strand:+ start:4096 stop:4590 length:495 start_codon:yes stop_codon:yes gene_type:complete
MASTITASTMKVTISENITLNGRQQGGSQIFNIASINEIFKRIVTCPANQDTTVALFQSAVSDDIESLGLDTQDVKYIRVTNLDDTNAINLSLQLDAGEDDSAADESATISLAAGQSYVMGTSHDSVAVSDANANINATLHDLESILIDPVANAVDVEIFVASI